MTPAPPGLAVSYSAAREQFRVAAMAAGAQVTASIYPHSVAPDGACLAVDVAQVGSVNAPATLVIISGTQGVSGFAGSALQSHWLQAMSSSVPASVRVVLVHGVNPYGFAWHRRTDEDNVDQRRNFLDWSAPPDPNSDYANLADLLVPADWSPLGQTNSAAGLARHASALGIDEFRKIVSAGQGAFPAGLFYRGNGPTWSHLWLEANLAQLTTGAQRLALLDVCTGEGEWGVGRVIVDAGNSTLRRRLTGLLPSTEFTALMLKFGSADMVTAFQALRAAAWAHAYSQPGSTKSQAVSSQVRAAFLDDDPAWLARLVPRFEDVVTQTMASLDQGHSLL